MNNILERFNKNLDEVWEADTMLDSIILSLRNLNHDNKSCSCITQTLGMYARDLATKNWTFLEEKDSYLNSLRMACTQELSLTETLNFFKMEKSKLEEVKRAFSNMK